MTQKPDESQTDGGNANVDPMDAPHAPRAVAPEPPGAGVPLSDRIAVLPGAERVAYRPGVLLVKMQLDHVDGGTISEIADEQKVELFERAVEKGRLPSPVAVERVFEGAGAAEDALGIWFKLTGVPDAPGNVGTTNVEVEWGDLTIRLELRSGLDLVYFASDSCRCGCPPHPASATPLTANPWTANPWTANPWTANPWTANPWTANAVALNVAVTGKPPTSSAMPALKPQSAPPTQPVGAGVVVGILDSGLAGEVWNSDNQDWDQMCPKLLISPLVKGELDVPDAKIGGILDGYLDPVAGHGTFIAGIIQQRIPGCRIHVGKVFLPEGDVAASWLAVRVWDFMTTVQPSIVNLSFGGAGSDPDGLFESAIRHFHDQHGVVFVGSAGNEGTCVEQYPAAMPEVIAVGAFGPNGPPPWTNYGWWVDACAPGTDIVSSFFANFDGELPRINGIDPDNFDEWATWSGTSFATPIVVAALAREIATTGCTGSEAVERVIRAPHLARAPQLGTIVNY